ncbi:MAG: bifunctional UDP-N-acetylglucosamine diphosphorylase/glucosamine-1-phosphate N-acetyltransferase GlmU [Sporolactobacillus sp.]
MSDRYAVVLAAGQGTRMKSNVHKVLHSVCGKPMLCHVMDQMASIGFTEKVVVVGRQAAAVERCVGKAATCVYQKEQLGTAHAVMQASGRLADRAGTTVVLYGDTPLVSHVTIQKLIDFRQKEKTAAAVLSAVTSQPAGYGRVVRATDGSLMRIVEDKDAAPAEKAIDEINTGIYCFDNELLFRYLRKVDNHNAQGEYYLPDVLALLVGDGYSVSVCQTPDFEETVGVNDRIQLAAAERYMRKRINREHMENGVTLIDPNTTYIAADCKIGMDTIIKPGTVIEGNTVIGNGCIIGPYSHIMDCRIGEGTVVEQSVLEKSVIADNVQIGPFAHLRPQSSVLSRAKIGNFVEVKKSEIGRDSKASHLTYIGDATIGSDVNMGCGTITVNYDGVNKLKTTIGDGAFIGCNANLVAPVTIGKGAYVAAGSTITQSVNEDALAIARSRQTNKEGYAQKLPYRNH